MASDAVAPHLLLEIDGHQGEDEPQLQPRVGHRALYVRPVLLLHEHLVAHRPANIERYSSCGSLSRKE